MVRGDVRDKPKKNAGKDMLVIFRSSLGGKMSRFSFCKLEYFPDINISGQNILKIINISFSHTTGSIEIQLKWLLGWLYPNKL